MVQLRQGERVRSKEATHLAADVDLVASGVSKECNDDDLKTFLENKGVNVVAVETLTKADVLPNVRTKTFKVTVKASHYEKALLPESWPYRVGVRHFRAARRTENSWQSQSARAGGLVDKESQRGGTDQAQGVNVQSGGGNQYPVGHPSRYRQQHQSLPDPVQISNLFGILGRLGGTEIPKYQ